PATVQLLRHAKNPLMGLHRVRHVAQASRPEVRWRVGVSVLAHPLGPLIVEHFRHWGTHCDNHRHNDARPGVATLGTLVPLRGGLSGLLGNASVEQDRGMTNAALPLVSRATVLLVEADPADRERFGT